MPKLFDILQKPEGRRIEFKQELPTSADLALTIISFINDAGKMSMFLIQVLFYRLTNDIRKDIVSLIFKNTVKIYK